MNLKEESVSFMFDYSSTTEFDNKPLDDNKYKSVFTYNRPHHGYESSNDNNPKETLLSKGIRYAVAGFCYVMLICTFPISFPLCVRKVPSLERLVVFRLGKMEKIKGPGFVLIMPCIDHWIKVDLRVQTFQTPKQQLLTVDGAILEVSAVLRYQIVDVIRSVLQVDRLEFVFKQLVEQCLSTAVTQRQEEDVTRQTHILQMDMQNMLNKSTVAWGLEVIQVDMQINILLKESEPSQSIKSPPVQILKAADERSAMSALMTALNTAMGIQETPESHCSNLSISEVASGFSNESSGLSDVDQAFSSLSKMVATCSDQGAFKDQEGVIRLEITDSRRIFYLSIKNGIGDLYEDLVGAGQASANVTLSCTSEILVQMLRKRLNPIHAYTNGLVTLDGDWTMLRNFTKLISKQA